MTRQIGNLIFGIILVVLAVGGFALDAMHGTISPKNMVLHGSLVLFAVSRFMMFGAPALPVIKPLRTVALIGVVLSFILPKT